MIEDPIQQFDQYTSPVHNPVGVCFCFNLIFAALALSLVSLMMLGETSTYVYVLMGSSLLLWMAVNVLLVEVYRRAQVKQQQQEEKAN